MKAVPLIRARPSLASSRSGRSPAASRAAAPGSRRPSTMASPRPIIGNAIWASGARSPLAPREPWAGTTGWTPRLSISMSSWRTSGRTPEWPRAREFSRATIIARTCSSESSGPTPTAWLCNRLCCRSDACSGEMRMFRRCPNPVVTP
jgi:hypothetical protein